MRRLQLVICMTKPFMPHLCNCVIVLLPSSDLILPDALQYFQKTVYWSYSAWRDTIESSQKPESQMSTSIRSCIRSTEPPQMDLTGFNVQQRRFYERKSKFMGWSSPVPPSIQSYIPHLISIAKRYIPSFFLHSGDRLHLGDGSELHVFISYVKSYLYGKTRISRLVAQFPDLVRDFHALM